MVTSDTWDSRYATSILSSSIIMFYSFFEPLLEALTDVSYGNPRHSNYLEDHITAAPP